MQVERSRRHLWTAGRPRGAQPHLTGSAVQAGGGPVLRVLAHARTALFLVFWLGLIGVWVATCAQLGLAGDWHFAVLAGIDLGLLVILYLAEGMELAATDLLDKDPEQVGAGSVRAVLREIQGRQGFFYANRQVFVVVVIAFMTQTTTYPWIFVPGAGRIAAASAPAWFGFLLTTLTVLWFAQVTPKRLAIVNSELFLKQSRMIWYLIRLVGAAGLTTPTDLMETLARRYTSYREHRSLLPSRAIHYSNDARLRGYALDRLSVSLRLGRDGVTSIRKRFLVLLLHGPHRATYGSIETPAGLRRTPNVRVLGLFRAAVPERLETMASELDSIFDGRPPRPGSGLTPLPLDDWKHEVVVDHEETSLDGRTTTFWEIRGESLPGSYQNPPPGSGERRRVMVALLYEVEAAYGPGESDSPATSWSEAIALPCRLLTMDVEAGQGRAAIVTLVTATETEQRTDQFLSERSLASIPYPVLGATYTLHWTTVRTGRLKANGAPAR